MCYVQPHRNYLLPVGSEYLLGGVRIGVNVVLRMRSDIAGIEIGATHHHKPAHKLCQVWPEGKRHCDIGVWAHGNENEFTRKLLCHSDDGLRCGEIRLFGQRIRKLCASKSIATVNVRRIYVFRHQGPAGSAEYRYIFATEQTQHLKRVSRGEVNAHVARNG